jgi:hypothetical protein
MRISSKQTAFLRKVGVTAKLSLVLPLILLRVGAQPLSVCEALSKASELHGKRVEIRGLWTNGHTGQRLWPVAPCELPTIRDGWQFIDGIQVEVEHGFNDVSRFHTQYGDFTKAHGNKKVVATLSGRFEAPEHLDLWTDGFGVTLPRAFGISFAARFSISSAYQLKAVELRPSEEEALLEKLKHPEPKRVVERNSLK